MSSRTRRPAAALAVLIVAIASFLCAVLPASVAEAVPPTTTVTFTTAQYAAATAISWTVPAHTGPITIVAAGGDGGDYDNGTLTPGGTGAVVTESVSATTGQQATVILGADGAENGTSAMSGDGGLGYGRGGNGNTSYGGGGGSTAVLIASTPQVVSGGGGGGAPGKGGAGGTPAGGAGSNAGGAPAHGGNAGVGGAGASSALDGPSGLPGGNGFAAAGGDTQSFSGGGGGGGYGGGGAGSTASSGAGGGSYASTTATYTSRTDTTSGGWVTFTYTLPTATVTFNSEGGTAVPAGTVTVGGTIAAPAAPNETGYSFDGWYTAATGGSPWAFADPVTADMTLYAHWTPPATLSVSPSVDTVLAGTAVTYAATGEDAHADPLGDVTSATTFIIANTAIGGPTGTCTLNSCTATDPGTYTVTAADGSATGTSILTVLAPATITTTSLPAGTVGTAYEATLTIVGGLPGPHVFALSSTSVLPPGLSLATDGSLSGTPTKTGTTTFRITADGGPARTLTITVAPAAILPAVLGYTGTPSPTAAITTGLGLLLLGVLFLLRGALLRRRVKDAV